MAADMNDPVYQLIVAARVQLLFDKPFFGNVAARLALVDATSWCDTAATDGRHLYYNREFIKKLTKDELMFLVTHEILHCFPTGTIVPGTFKPIEAIQPDDLVIGEGGRHSRAVVLMSKPYKGPMHSVHARGLLPLPMTPEHPVLIARPTWKTVEDGGIRRNERVLSKPDYFAAADVRRGDWVQVPRAHGTISDYRMTFEVLANPWSSPQEIRDGVPLDAEVASFLGYYVAEGCTTETRDGDFVSAISMHKNETPVLERLRGILSARFGVFSSVQPNGENGAKLQFSSAPLGRWLREHCGVGATDKRMPLPVLYNTDERILTEFLWAHVDGDGTIGRAVGFATASNTLALQVQMGWARLGVLMNLHERPPREAVKKSGEVIRSGPLFTGSSAYVRAFDIMGRPSKACRSTRFFIAEDGALWTPVKSIGVTMYDGMVHNMETTCHTYAAGNMMTHNCIYDHLGRRGGRDPKLLNMAQDYVINYTLVEDKCGTMPKNGLYDKRFPDTMLSEEVYEILKKESVTIQLPLDMHLDLLGEDPKDGDGQGGEQDQQGKGQQPGEGDGSGDEQNGKSGGAGQQNVQVTVMGKNGPPRLTPEDIAKIQSEMKASVIQAAHAVGAGSVPKGVARMIEDLISPKLDWRSLLDAHIRSSVKDDYTFQRLSRKTSALRFAASEEDDDREEAEFARLHGRGDSRDHFEGEFSMRAGAAGALADEIDAPVGGKGRSDAVEELIAQALSGAGIAPEPDDDEASPDFSLVVPMLPTQDYMDTIDIMVAIDASGSMTEEMLRDMLSETKGIMQTFRDFRVRVCTFDTQLYNYREYTGENIDEIDEQPMQGGGGTLFECVWEFMKREGIEPNRLVLFTDGLPNQSWGEEGYVDTLFVIHTHTNIRAPWGLTAYYEPDK